MNVRGEIVLFRVLNFTTLKLSNDVLAYVFNKQPLINIRIICHID